MPLISSRHIPVLNHAYSALTGVASYFILVELNLLPTTVNVLVAGFLPILINHGKDLINEKDDTTNLGKLKQKFDQLESQHNDLKDQLETKDSILAALKSELTNYTTGKRTARDAQSLVLGVVKWCAEDEDLYKTSNATNHKTNLHKDKIRQYIPTNSDL
ncbi:hypothetical protein DYI81_08455 [Acinetobacter sp. SWAC5]|uniref:hypothetical protein n=1 Tax=Acinetobacter sp. SWAC5 TaxID=2293835 RepID=UPI000E3420D9|nr:hypothetical protein [Acinetobacter sp. SWAC5]RFS31345.1 hypothetical protein DYI81_08455 [Acinetobacter sp. SWAC5]